MALPHCLGKASVGAIRIETCARDELQQSAGSSRSLPLRRKSGRARSAASLLLLVHLDHAVRVAPAGSANVGTEITIASAARTREDPARAANKSSRQLRQADAIAFVSG
jgi:hypothetical protein